MEVEEKPKVLRYQWLRIPLNDVELLNVFPKSLELIKEVSNTHWSPPFYRLGTKNFEGGFDVSVHVDTALYGFAVCRIESPEGQVAIFPTSTKAFLVARVKECRLLCHLHSLTNDQCKQFIKDQNGGKGHKPKKEKK